MERLNYFNPYESKKPWHEDQLTRALLVVLRYVPLAHAAFLDIVREHQAGVSHSTPLPPFSALAHSDFTIETQVSTIRESSGRLLSVVLTDECWNPETQIESSDRGARYDGILAYANAWVLVIENKPRHSMTGMWKEQLKPNLCEGSEVEIEPEPVVVPWRLIVDRLNRLVQRDMLAGAERTLLDDFLTYVDARFNYLNPFDKLSRCKDDLYLLGRRCRRLMETIAPGPVTYHRGFKYGMKLDTGAVREIYVSPTKGVGDWDVCLEMYPGDTVSQARDFYARLDKTRFLDLEHRGWKIEPNMHFAFMATNLVWSHVGMSLADYVDFWLTKKRHIRREDRVDADGFQPFFHAMLNERLVSQGDLPNLHEKFQQTNRNTINICPGVALTYRWMKEITCELDDQSKFGQAIKDKINEALGTWQQTF